MQQKAENEGKSKGGSPVEQMEFQRIPGRDPPRVPFLLLPLSV